jgi:autonomous glycyl radical cofactor GrcA
LIGGEASETSCASTNNHREVAEVTLPDWICEVDTAQQLDAEIRGIAALENIGKGNELYGTLTVKYSEESVKTASLVPWLENRGIAVVWHKL